MTIDRLGEQANIPSCFMKKLSDVLRLLFKKFSVAQTKDAANTLLLLTVRLLLIDESLFIL